MVTDRVVQVCYTFRTTDEHFLRTRGTAGFSVHFYWVGDEPRGTLDTSVFIVRASAGPQTDPFVFFDVGCKSTRLSSVYFRESNQYYIQVSGALYQWEVTVTGR